MKSDASRLRFHLIAIIIGIFIGLLEFISCPMSAAAAITLDFTPGTVLFPDFTNITDEFSSQGIIFSDDDGDLPLEFQKSLGSMEHIVISNTLFNLFRINFLSVEPVLSVSVILGDNNVNAQTHTLTAFDSAGNIVDSDSFTEDGLFPDTFILTVSANSGIAFVVAIEQPFGAERVELITYTTGAIPVSIDIKPGSDPNSINCNNANGIIPVAILTTDDFDATTVDHTTVAFEGATESHTDPRSGEPRRHEEDVDGDGDIDLVFHFRLGDTDLTCGSTEGTLTGETFDGAVIEGIDSVNMIGS